MESIITAIIAGGLALIVSSGQKKTEQRLQTAQAVTDCKIDELWFDNDIKTLDRFRHLAYTKQVVKNTMFLCCRKVH